METAVEQLLARHFKMRISQQCERCDFESVQYVSDESVRTVRNAVLLASAETFKQMREHLSDAHKAEI